MTTVEPIEPNPAEFFSEASRQLRGGFSSSSAADKGGSRGSGIADLSLRAHPNGSLLDDHDRQLLAVVRRYEELLARESTPEVLARLQAIERGVRGAMGLYDTHHPDPDVAVLEMRRARRRATRMMVDEESEGGTWVSCKWCEDEFQLSARKRLRRGLCDACYQWALANPGYDALPEHVKVRRVERMVREQHDRKIADELDARSGVPDE